MPTLSAEAYQPKGDAASEAIHSAKPAGLGVADLALLGLFTAVLLALSYLQSRNRMFWGDEVMESYVLNSGSWHRFMQLWHGGIDSSGFWFYVLAKPWAWIFGASEVSLRMFSAVGIVASMALLWSVARRFYPVTVVAVAIALPYFDLRVLRWQLSNGRCYGLLMAFTALVIYLIVRGVDEAHKVPRVRFLLATSVAYDLLAGSHILGMLFAFALLAIQIAVDRRNRYWRPRVYGAAVAGIVAIVLFSLQNIRSTTALGKPVFWTSKPLIRSLWFATDDTHSPPKWILLGLLAMTVLFLRRRPARDAVYLLLCGFLILHCGFVLISLVSTSIYVDRYLLPFTFALVLAIAELLFQVQEQATVPRWRFYLLLSGTALSALYCAPRAEPFPLPARNYYDRLLADLPGSLPVIDTDVGTFAEVEFYKHGHFGRPFLFPLDEGVTTDPTNPGGVSGFHEMDNFARFGIDAPDLQPTREILQKYPDFIVIVSATPTSWFRRRIQNTGGYAITDLGIHNYKIGDLQYWGVHKVSSAMEITKGSGRE